MARRAARKAARPPASHNAEASHDPIGLARRGCAPADAVAVGPAPCVEIGEGARASMRSSTVKGWAAEMLVYLSVVGGCGLAMGAPIVGWGTVAGGLPRDSVVNVVAGCSGIGGRSA